MPKFARVTLLGGMGVGKTTLAKAMEADYGFIAVLENPSAVKETLARLPDNAIEKSLINELLFLDQRDKLLKYAFSQPGNVVVDMDILIEKIWGDITLTDPVHRETFEKIYDFYEAHLPKPDLVVYLRCDPEENLRRIQKRARSFETGVDIEFLKKLDEYTETHIAHQKTKQRIMIVDVTSIDPENNPEHLHDVVSKIWRSIQGPVVSPPGMEP